MDNYKYARLTPHSRADLVRRVLAARPEAVTTAAFGVCVKTLNKLVSSASRREAKQVWRNVQRSRPLGANWRSASWRASGTAPAFAREFR